jgi:uncharacterized protein (DUF2236 family)
MVSDVPDDPLFPPDAVIRRVDGEAALLFGAGRALLLQLAHPSVARGVVEHSDFERNPVRRLQGTLNASYTIVFGSRRDAAGVAAGIRRVHERVTGEGYTATDPSLLLWVHATLVDTALLVYSTLVGRLTSLEVTPDAIRAARALLHPSLLARGIPVSWAAEPVLALVRFITVGTLPEPIRRQYGFGWDGRRRAALRVGTEVTRRALAVVPPAIRRVA